MLISVVEAAKSMNEKCVILLMLFFKNILQFEIVVMSYDAHWYRKL